MSPQQNLETPTTPTKPLPSIEQLTLGASNQTHHQSLVPPARIHFKQEPDLLSDGFSPSSSFSSSTESSPDGRTFPNASFAYSFFGVDTPAFGFFNNGTNDLNNGYFNDMCIKSEIKSENLTPNFQMGQVFQYDGLINSGSLMDCIDKVKLETTQQVSVIKVSYLILKLLKYSKRKMFKDYCIRRAFAI